MLFTLNFNRPQPQGLSRADETCVNRRFPGTFGFHILIGIVALSGCAPSQPNGTQNASTNRAASEEAIASSNSAQAERAEPPEAKADNVQATSYEASQGRCGAGGCSYSMKQRQEVIGGGADGLLVKLTLLGASSSDTGSRLHFQRKAHTVYVYCSRTLPVTMKQSDGKWQVDVLDFITGVPSVLESSEVTYAETCHKNDSSFPNNAEALGYRAIPDDKSEVSVSKPEDIFQIANR